jgi:hypothetical protein
MRRSLQLSQLRCLSLDVLRTCASRVAREAHVAISRRKSRTKSSLSEFVVDILRSSLHAIENNSISHTRSKVLERLRLTPNPSILHNHDILLDFFHTLLEPAVFNAFTIDAQLSSADLSKRARYAKRCPAAIVPPTEPPGPSSLPPVLDWPQITPQHVVLDCCRNYFDATVWTKPQTCAVCARARTGTKSKWLLVPFTDCALPLLNILRIPATSPLHDTEPFVFQHLALNNTMLHSDGIHVVEGGVKLCICYDCYTPLSATPPRVPKFALKNNLYRGSLPNHLLDITWVEEQVCALYRSTAIVTRLYGSDDPSQPHVFRGNTCAFAQNTVSTAQKLPRTPSDVNDMLSVVFTGPNVKIPESCLKNVFRVRKQKILDFLDFLRHHNILYNEIELDYSIVDLYPVDGPLPGWSTSWSRRPCHRELC